MTTEDTLTHLEDEHIDALFEYQEGMEALISLNNKITCPGCRREALTNTRELLLVQVCQMTRELVKMDDADEEAEEITH